MCLQGECIHFHEDLKNLKMDLHYWGQVSTYSLEGQPGPFGPFTMEEDLYAAAGVQLQLQSLLCVYCFLKTLHVRAISLELPDVRGRLFFLNRHAAFVHHH